MPEPVQARTSAQRATAHSPSLPHPRSAAFPVGVLLAAKWRLTTVRPGEFLGAIVGRVHDDRVLGEAQIVQCLEHLTDRTVMFDHTVGIDAETGLAFTLGFEARPHVHTCRVPPQEERFVVILGSLQKVDSRVGHPLVDGLHTFLSERPCGFNATVGIGVQNTTWPKTLLEFGVLRLVGMLRFV